MVAVRNSEIQKVEFKFIGFMFVPDLNDWLISKSSSFLVQSILTDFS